MRHANPIAVVVLAAGLLSLATVAPARAQRRRPPQAPPGGQSTAADVSGQFVALEGDVIQLVDQQQQPYLAKFNLERASVLILGQADASFLRPGLFVRFQCPLDERGHSPPDEELEKLSLVTPGPTAYPGVTSEDLSNPNAPYDVIGQIKSLRKGKMVVLAGEAQVTVKVSPDAEIEVKVTDLSWCTPGDPITVKGRFVGPGQILCDLVEVKMREPLSGDRKKKKRPSRSKERDDVPDSDGAPSGGERD